MSSVSLPLTFNAVGCDDVKQPLKTLKKTISSLGPDELLVQISYASINPMDPKLHQNNFFNLEKPLVLGFNYSGTVVAVGGEGKTSAGQSIVVGSEVFGNCSPQAGAFAEYVKVNRHSPIALRGSIPFPEGSCYGVAYLSAWEPLMVVDDLSKRHGQWIYIPGAAGGVGHFAAQLAKLHGLKVIGSGGKKESLDYLKQLKLDHIIDYSKQDVATEILKLTGGKGVDVVYDSTYSKQSFNQSASVVAKGGKWIRLGAMPDGLDDEAKKTVQQRGAEATFGDLGRYFMNPQYQKDILTKALVQAETWYKEGKVKPHIGATVPLEPTALTKALADVGQGKTVAGKVVVKVKG